MGPATALGYVPCPLGLPQTLTAAQTGPAPKFATYSTWELESGAPYEHHGNVTL